MYLRGALCSRQLGLPVTCNLPKANVTCNLQLAAGDLLCGWNLKSKIINLK